MSSIIMTMDQWQRDIVAAREKVKKLEAARDALAEKCLVLQQELDDRTEACAKLCEDEGDAFGHEGLTEREGVMASTFYAAADTIRGEFQTKCEQGIKPQTKGESR